MTHPATRTTVLFDAGDDAAESLYRGWLARVREQLTLVSDDQGCGCCIHSFDIEGAAEAIASLPAELQCESAWSQPEATARHAALRDTNARADVQREAARAFHEERYSEVVRVLAPLEGQLSDAQRAKLEYARRHHSPLREWWNKLTRRCS